MPRKVDEWIGKTPDSKIPERVLIRVYDREGGICHVCGLSLKGKKWEADHRPALINGGENRESKIFPACKPCHREITKKDVAEKAKTAAMKANAIGLRPKSKFAKVDKPQRTGKPKLPPRQMYGAIE
jgi:5-methylcytosine-specific restriction protein A